MHIPAVPVAEAVEPTGCGDALRAGLLLGLSQGQDLASAARLGATAASFCVEHFGTQEHYFTMDEFLKRHREAYCDAC